MAKETPCGQVSRAQGSFTRCTSVCQGPGIQRGLISGQTFPKRPAVSWGSQPIGQERGSEHLCGHHHKHHKPRGSEPWPRCGRMAGCLEAQVSLCPASNACGPGNSLAPGHITVATASIFTWLLLFPLCLLLSVRGPCLCL
jgi:hypothetical protein